MILNERQVGLKVGGNYSTLTDYLNKIVVKTLPFVNSQSIVVPNVNVVLIPSTILSGVVSIGLTTTTNDGIVAAQEPTFTAGTAAFSLGSLVTDALGNVANLVRIRNATTHDPVLYNNESEVYGLIQVANGVADGAAIAGVGVENLQMSFVYVQANGTFAGVTVNETIEFQVNKAFKERLTPTYVVESGNVAPDVLVTQIPAQKETRYVVTNGFANGEAIDLTTGAGGIAGTTTVTGDSTAAINIGVDNAAFLAFDDLEFFVNGVLQVKGTDFTRNSTTAVLVNMILDIGDVLTVRWK